LDNLFYFKNTLNAHGLEPGTLNSNLGSTMYQLFDFEQIITPLGNSISLFLEEDKYIYFSVVMRIEALAYAEYRKECLDIGIISYFLIIKIICPC
jgi:hypothetical protein